jgi:hypothetical protein
MINGGALRTQSLFTGLNSLSKNPEELLGSRLKPILLCRKCGKEFTLYKGMKRFGPQGSGIGYCPEDNPKPPSKDQASSSPDAS